MKQSSIENAASEAPNLEAEAARRCEDPHRRCLLFTLAFGVLCLLLRPLAYCRTILADRTGHAGSRDRTVAMNSAGKKSGTSFRGSMNLGTGKDGNSRVYMARGGSPGENVRQVLEKLGGIRSIIGSEDIVVLKPNAQWWNQGTTNTDAMEAFIEAVLGIPGFRGEVIIAENHQYANPDSRGWSTAMRNGKRNLNELVLHFNRSGFRNVTKYHWRCAGPNPEPLQGSESSGSKIVTGPWEGDGYVWNPDLVHVSPLGRKCILAYPVFTSSYSGVTVDFRYGAWKNGLYTGQPVKFINFSALNHHSEYCGVTASVKNYMGVVDMTCGFQGVRPEGYWNTHFIGIRQGFRVPFLAYLPWRIRIKVDKLYKMRYFHHSGGVLGSFMRQVRFADLNIITAHWVGYASRTDAKLSGFPRTLLAGTDPVALDYVAGTQVMAPLTREKAPKSAWLNRVNDVSDREGPFYRFLAACHREGIGNIDPERMKII